MRNVEEMMDSIALTYRDIGPQAEEYLRKARKLKGLYGSGFAVVYCWFYSVPQKWIQVEPKIFELAEKTNSFDLNTLSAAPTESLAARLKPMIFYNEISSQLKNFCRVVKDEYSSWDEFVGALSTESVFTLFEKLRKYRRIRITFKNLAAMKIFVGMNNNQLILDTHVARILRINKKDMSKYRVQPKRFQELLGYAGKVTNELKGRGFGDISMAKWSLAIWFDQAKSGW